MNTSVANVDSSSLVWTSPDVARQIEISRYVSFLVLGGWLCELVMSIRRDFYIWRRVWSPWTDPFYVLARYLSPRQYFQENDVLKFYRITTLGFLLSGLVFQVLPIKNCRRFIDGVQTFYSFALPMSTHLFFFRIQAVFNDSRPAVYFFLLLRVVVCSGAILQATGAKAAHIGPTMDCMLIDLHTYCAMGTLAVAFNDTLVVFAISTRLLMDSLATTWKLRLKALRKGKGMGQVSRILLRTGQQYYIATIGINICAAVVILIPSIPPTIRELMYYPSVAIVNIMASRAFRQLRVEMMKGSVTSFSVDLGGIDGHDSPSQLKVSDLEWANPSNEQTGSSTNDGRPSWAERLRHTREIGQLSICEASA